ncbi:molybdenum cofactor guanylyltransferase MobA [Hyphomicrobium sp. CS1GBMeth3]|uniref:molybdenum cofactor guanylyltransferase MobA n=1 Tax=Hyphomicrobium sp. CS1GBMeth3 TaxID=1892845 RepID=UPI0009FAB063|nr:molybdenum cofactor guanylyltransferase MobA [Hyphomicrobium sp. CS1GBMeth3]
MSHGIAGVLLAGGLGRRLGGDKALVALAGRPLVWHTARRLKPQVEMLILNANGDPDRFAWLGLPVVADESGDFAGPLAGVLAGLNWFKRERPDVRAMVSVSADAPFIPHDLVDRLDAALAAHPDARVAVAQSRSRRHHVIGLWRPDAAGDIAFQLARGERKAETMVDRLGAVSVPFEDFDLGGEAGDPFFNVNTPEDLAFAESAVARAKPRVVGVAGWKNSGKTTLVVKLVGELVRRGYRVSTVKHSHHEIASETEGTDSARHREAGAQQVALVTPSRWALVSGADRIVWRDEREAPLEDVVAALAPADVVIVEGMKSAQIPKIEVRRLGQGDGGPLAERDPEVFAVASDQDLRGARVPVFSIDDVGGLTDSLLAKVGLPLRKEAS